MTQGQSEASQDASSRPTDVSLHSLPLFFKVATAPVLVVGGGRVAARRVRRLCAAGAHVTVIASERHADMALCMRTHDVVWHARDFRDADVAHQRLAFAASDAAEVNARVVAAARAAAVPVHRVDVATDSDFHIPALVNRAPLLIALSTDAQAPTLVRRLHADLETRIPAAYGNLAALASRFRSRAAWLLPPRRRAAFWDTVFDGPIAQKVFAGREREAERDLAVALARHDGGHAQMRQGEVYLVGAGPGDPDLLTFRALRLMQRADVVLYDSLVAPAIVDLVRSDAERIHVGKRASRHTLAQADINATLVRLAQAGKRVLRLKGGDPFVFGRGGEEIEPLAEAGIAFQVVPGITAPGGCAAYAGIPLTHRDYARAVVFATGHRRAGELALDWPALARRNQTVVFFMGRATLPRICAQLRAHGLPADWPAALIVSGTTQDQQVIASDLAELPQRAATVDAAGPGLVIVGEVVRLNEKLGWFRGTNPASAA